MTMTKADILALSIILLVALGWGAAMTVSMVLSSSQVALWAAVGFTVVTCGVSLVAICLSKSDLDWS